MARHKHADLIHAWAEGAEIQIMESPEKWRTVKSPSFLSSIEHRIKPKETEWWENIPEHGVLCWVIEDVEVELRPEVIVEWQIRNDRMYFNDFYIAATPLTNEEIERFKR